MNSSERVSLFSRAKNSFLAYKNGVFSWIKLLFIPSVAKRSSVPKLSFENDSFRTYSVFVMSIIMLIMTIIIFFHS